MSGFAGPHGGAVNSFNPGAYPPPALSNGRRISGSGSSDMHQIHQLHGEQPNKGNNVAIHRPRLNRRSHHGEKSSSLTTKFDPMTDRHMWAMWRTAVNGRIVDQVRRNEQSKHDASASENFSTVVGSDETRSTMYGKDLTSVPPLSRFIRLNQKSKDIAQGLMNEGQGKLETTQFIYYGLPRVSVNTNNHWNTHDNSSNSNNNHYVNGGLTAGNTHSATNNNSDNDYGLKNPGPQYSPYHDFTGR